jgi:hypothetical protein
MNTPDPPEINVGAGKPQSGSDRFNEASLPDHSGAEDHDPSTGFHEPSELRELLLPTKQRIGRILRSEVE